MFFTNASRHIVAAILKSLIRHNAGAWNFSDFVAIALNRGLTKQILARDPAGKRDLDRYLPDSRTGDDVYATLCTHVGYFEPIAALWKKTTKQLSIREWLGTSSVLMLGQNATASAVLKVLNEQLFRFFADQVDIQRNSSQRRTFVWLEEAREAKGIIETESLQQLANKGRSKGVVLVIAFQSIEGFYDAAGVEKADNLIGQCSHKALLRMESPKSAKWASELLGQYETIEVFRSDGGQMLNSEGLSEQRAQRDAVLPSEFYAIPETTKENGLTGYFIRPSHTPCKVWVSPEVVAGVAVSDEEEQKYEIVYRPEADQWLAEMSTGDADRLGIEIKRNQQLGPARSPSKRLRLPTVSSLEKTGVSQIARIEKVFLDNRSRM